MIKRFLIVFSITISLTAILVYRQWPDSAVHVIFCDVGQGDAIFIQYGFWQFLVDGGPDDKVLDCLNAYMPFWDKKIEFVVATHADSDHISGLIDVLQKYQVQELMIGEGKDSEDFRELKELLINQQQQGLMIKKPFLGQKIELSNRLKARILSLHSDSEANFFDFNSNLTEASLLDNISSDQSTEINYNNSSIVILLEIDDLKIILMGDLEIEGEQALIDAGMLTDVDVLKVGHHGSKSSSSLDFLEMIQPEFSVISCGKNNQFKHPNDEVLVNLEKIGSNILRTDQIGNIHLISNGRFYYFNFK